MSPHFTVDFYMDNAAFESEDWASETSRILAAIARNVEGGETSGNCRDVNGNIIGKWGVESTSRLSGGNYE